MTCKWGIFRHYRSVAASEPLTLQWIDAIKGQLPEFAQLAGMEEQNHVYVGRAHFEGGVVPGKFLAENQKLYFGYNGKEFESEQYQILVSPPGCVSWVEARGGQMIPQHAIPGGQDPGSKEVYYIGRAIHNGMVTAGKVQPSHRCCYIPQGGKEFKYTHFEVLTKNLLGRNLNV